MSISINYANTSVKSGMQTRINAFCHVIYAAGKSYLEHHGTLNGPIDMYIPSVPGATTGAF